MKVIRPKLTSYFQVLESTGRGQVAEMVLSPGQSTGGPNNRHAESDQWLYVVEGNGEAEVEEKTVKIKRGEILLIEKGQGHEIRNTGKSELKTLNWYTPAEY